MDRLHDPKLQRRLARLRWIEDFQLARAATKEREAKRAYRRGIAAQVARLELEDTLR